MNAYRNTLILIFSMAVLALPACSQESRTGRQAPGGPFAGQQNTESTTASITDVDTSLLVKAQDDVSTVQAKRSVTLTLSTLTVSGADGVTVSRETKSDGSTYITIDSSGISDALSLTITGTLAKGTVEIIPSKKADVIVTLKDASITSGNYPALTVSSGSRTFLVLQGSSTLTDGRSYGTGYSEKEGTGYYTSSCSGTKADGAELTQKWQEGDSTKATLYTKGPLIISGRGTLTVNESYKHGLYAKDYIRISGGTILVNNGGRSAVRSRNGFVMDAGTLTIRGTATHTAHPNDDSRGIIVEGDESSDGAGKGYIYISGGTVDITSTGKAISAKWDIDDDAKTTTESDDPNPVVMITGGTVTVRTTDAVVDSDMRSRTISYYDADGVKVTETEKCSPEGIEGKTGVIVTGGKISVQTTDDALNASLDRNGYVNILGGELYLYATQADAIDSNGDITISGGTIVAVAPMGSEDGFDCDGMLSFTGGIAVGVSGSSRSYASAQNVTNTQNVLVLGQDAAGSAGSTLAVLDESGTAVFAFTIPAELSRYGIVTLSSPLIAAGKTYTVRAGATVTGGTSFHGLYTKLPSVSGGTESVSVTTRSGTTVYTLGQAGSGFGGPGGFGAGRGGRAPDGMQPPPDSQGNVPRGGRRMR